MERTKKIINIGKNRPSLFFPTDYIDRLLAEGAKNVSVNIDDIAETIIIRPIFPETAK